MRSESAAGWAPVAEPEAAPKYVYDFAEGSREMRDLLGGKGANVAEMTRVLGPDRVPAGFTITTAAGVSWLVRLAAWVGRERNADLELGVCGEHAGDPASIAFFQRAGLDYVSCSPFRIPVARLAAAQAAARAASEVNHPPMKGALLDRE